MNFFGWVLCIDSTLTHFFFYLFLFLFWGSYERGHARDVSLLETYMWVANGPASRTGLIFFLLQLFLG